MKIRGYMQSFRIKELEDGEEVILWVTDSNSLLFPVEINISQYEIVSAVSDGLTIKKKPNMPIDIIG